MNRTGKWEKLGLIFCPTGNIPWMQTHAAVPIAENIGGSLFRIYFSSRDSANRSHTGYIIIDIHRPLSVLDISTEPVLQPGPLGCFDDSGAMATWLVNFQGRRFLYYIGWNLGVTVPFRNSIGLAVGEGHSATFVKHSRGPILDRTAHEPHFCASCCVVPDSNRLRMWYLSCTEWFMKSGKAQHRYHLKYAESADGITWERTGHVAIEYSNDSETAISRPSVIRDVDGWRMWYSYRGERYRIGYAESQDGKHWSRRDDRAGISVSSSGWDSDMIEYPHVFDYDGARYMLYNGNGYGLTGLGIAVLS